MVIILNILTENAETLNLTIVLCFTYTLGLIMHISFSTKQNHEDLMLNFAELRCIAMHENIILLVLAQHMLSTCGIAYVSSVYFFFLLFRATTFSK